MICINYVYTNLYDIVKNISSFSLYETISTIKYIPSIILNTKINIITNIYNNIKKNDDTNLKPKSIHKFTKKNNTYNDNTDDNNCDWGWFVEIDEY